MYVGLMLSILRWLPRAVLLWVAKAVVLVIAPIIALPPFVRLAEENETTGFPSLFPGKPREFLVPWLMWAQTHDAPLDEYGVEHYYKGKWTERFKNWRWLMRVCWLWRNPAYGLAEAMGFDQTGIEPIAERDDGTWRLPITDCQYWIVRNAHRRIGFMLRGQFRLWRGRYMEYRLGYGLYRESPKRNKGMVYARAFKLRKY